jgi:hypothetical protein
MLSPAAMESEEEPTETQTGKVERNLSESAGPLVSL